MSEFDFYEELKASLEDAIAYKQGDHSRCRVLLPEVPVPDYKAADIVRARKGLNLSQRSLANLIGVSPRTVEAWETGKNEPAAPTRCLLYLLETDHSLVERLTFR
ncbi:MAG: helix-turn-helix domain-containing protein [Angelakisella sp.]|jgi:putative transcriptional regulator|nr:helix-turn-helix domain-containing protein [Angelakisella sp.]